METLHRPCAAVAAAAGPRRPCREPIGSPDVCTPRHPPGTGLPREVMRLRACLAALLCLGWLLSACTENKVPPQKPLPAETQAAMAYLSRLPQDKTGDWLEASDVEVLHALPRETRVAVAQQARASYDPALWPLAANEFYALGDDASGDATVAHMVARGKTQDVMELLWDWLHGDHPEGTDPRLMERRVVKVSWILLDRYPRLAPEEQRAASQFMCGVDACNLDYVRRELREKEAELGPPFATPAPASVPPEDQAAPRQQGGD